MSTSIARATFAAYATKINGAWALVYSGVPFVDATGISRPGNWLELASDEEREAAQVYALPEPDAPPVGKVEAGRIPVGEDRPEWQVTYTDAPPPAPEPVPNEVADWQFAGQAAEEGIITRAEALAWAARGEVPKTLDDAVAQAVPDPDALFNIRLLLAGAKSYLRTNPLVPLLGQVFGKDAAGLDQFWRDAAKRGV